MRTDVFAQRRKKWAHDRTQMATRLGVTEDQAVELLETLPYSDIPGWDDVTNILDWLQAHGWTREVKP